MLLRDAAALRGGAGFRLAAVFLVAAAFPAAVFTTDLVALFLAGFFEPERAGFGLGEEAFLVAFRDVFLCGMVMGTSLHSVIDTQMGPAQFPGRAIAACAMSNIIRQYRSLINMFVRFA